MNKRLSKLSLKSLKRDEKLYRNIFYVSIGLVFAIMIIGIYKYKGEFQFKQIMFLFFTPMIFANYIQLKKTKLPSP